LSYVLFSMKSEKEDAEEFDQFLAGSSASYLSQAALDSSIDG